MLDLLGSIQVLVNLSKLDLCPVFGVPKQEVRDLGKRLGTASAGLHERDGRHAVLGAEDFVEHDRQTVHVFAADLHEQAAGVAQEGPRQGGVAADVVQVGVDSLLVGVAERLDDNRIVREVLRRRAHPAVLHRRLEVAVEPDPVRRVVEDHLHLAGEAVPLGEGGHDPAGVAADEAVLPVAPVLVPLVGGAGGQVVVGRAEEVVRLPAVCGSRRQCSDEGGRVDLLVDVERVGVDRQVLGVVAAVPGEARFAVFVLPERRFVAVRRPVFLGHERRRLLGRQIQPAGGGMRVGLGRGLASRLLLRHRSSFAGHSFVRRSPPRRGPRRDRLARRPGGSTGSIARFPGMPRRPCSRAPGSTSPRQRGAWLRCRGRAVPCTR